MDNKHIKKRSISLVIRKIKIKTTMSYCFISIRMATFFLKKRKVISANENVEKLEHCILLTEMKRFRYYGN